MRAHIRIILWALLSFHLVSFASDDDDCFFGVCGIDPKPKIYFGGGGLVALFINGRGAENLSKVVERIPAAQLSAALYPNKPSAFIRLECDGKPTSCFIQLDPRQLDRQELLLGMNYAAVSKLSPEELQQLEARVKRAGYAGLSRYLGEDQMDFTFRMGRDEVSTMLAKAMYSGTRGEDGLDENGYGERWIQLSFMSLSCGFDKNDQANCEVKGAADITK